MHWYRKENELRDDKININDTENKSENDEQTGKTNKTSKSPKIIDFPPLPRVTSPQKLSRKNFDKHKISMALLKVTSISRWDNYGNIFIFTSERKNINL